MNKVILSGNFTKDLEIPNEKVGKFTLAVQRNVKDKDGYYGTDFINCIVFNPNDYVKQRVKKGSRALIEGEIRINTYESNGNKRYSTEIIVNKIEIYSQEQNNPKNVQKNPFEEFGDSIKTEFDVGEQIQIEDSDLPF